MRRYIVVDDKGWVATFPFDSLEAALDRASKLLPMKPFKDSQRIFVYRMDTESEAIVKAAEAIRDEGVRIL